MGQQLSFLSKFNFLLNKNKLSESKLIVKLNYKFSELDPKPIDLFFNKAHGLNTHLLQKMVMIEE